MRAMARPPSAAKELHATWARLGIDASAIDPEPDGTLRPSEALAPASAPTVASDAIQVTQQSAPGAGDGEEDAEDASGIVARLGTEEVFVGRQIGEGGMGTVWEARQRSLERDVAVKGIKRELDGPIGRAQLLREARVTGALEHPNIIPVHALVRGTTSAGAAQDGAPLMVMKRVEGTAWSDRMDATRGQPDFLEQQLRILMQVCHAVHFAHTRGVLHRDLKPENVMLGGFGEVYVLDWGIALALHDQTGIPGLPLARDARGVIGTIQYMAPEMVAGDGEHLCVQSDVYLLGAILHEILVDAPRHEGEALPQVLHAAWISEPYAYPPEVPAELAALANRACERDPAERPRSAEIFRQALESYLEHRESAELAEEAARRVASAEERAAADEDPVPALREARFAYKQALRIWPQNAAARAGLQDVLGALIDRALADQAVELARDLLAEMDEEHVGGWRSKVDALAAQVARREAKMRRLEEEAKQADLAPAARQRRVFGVGFALGFFALNVGLDVWDRRAGVGWWVYLIATGAVAGAFAIPVLVYLKSLFPTRAARRLAVALGMMLFGQAVTFTGLMLAGLELRPALGLSLLPLATVITVKAVLLDPRMWWAGLLALGAGALGIAWPESAFYGVGLAYSAFFLGGALLDYEGQLED